MSTPPAPSTMSASEWLGYTDHSLLRLSQLCQSQEAKVLTLESLPYSSPFPPPSNACTALETSLCKDQDKSCSLAKTDLSLCG